MELVEKILSKGKEDWSSRGECPRSGLNYLAIFFGSTPYESVFHRKNILVLIGIRIPAFAGMTCSSLEVKTMV
jgi:hypothetical protein